MYFSRRMKNRTKLERSRFSPLKIFGHILFSKMHVSLPCRVWRFIYVKKIYFLAPLSLSLQEGFPLLPRWSYKSTFITASRKALQYVPVLFKKNFRNELLTSELCLFLLNATCSALPSASLVTIIFSPCQAEKDLKKKKASPLSST